MKLYFDPIASVFGFDASKVPNVFLGGFCTGDSNEKRVQICTQRLVVSASLDAQPPTLERYLINDSSILSVFFNANSNPLGGYLKSYFREGFPYAGNAGGIDPTDPSFNRLTMRSWSSGPIFEFTKNANGSYVISSRIGAASPTGENGGFKATEFKRENHSGKYETSQGNLYDYTAKKL